MATIQFSLMSRKWFKMTNEQREAALEDIYKRGREAASRGEAFIPAGPANPFPPWLRDEIMRLQGAVRWRRFWAFVLKMFKVKAPLGRVVKWDGENQVYKLIRVKDEEADRIMERFTNGYTRALSRHPLWGKDLEDYQIHVSVMQDSDITMACDQDLWPEGEPPAQKEELLGNIMLQGAAKAKE